MQAKLQFDWPDYRSLHFLVKPEFQYVANMHGNEVVGKELVLKLGDYLCEKFTEGDKNIRKLIELTRIHLLPTMNPDGYEMAYQSVKIYKFFAQMLIV